MAETNATRPFRRPDVQKWLITGLLIRLVLMPITFHGDLLSIYQRAHLLLDGKSAKGLNHNILNMLHAGFLWVIRPLIPYHTLWGNIQVTSFRDVDSLSFINSTSIFRTLFLFKFPYLLFEILAIWMLLRLVEPERMGRVAAFWMLNPIVIFATYIFGRFDIIIVSLLLTALFFARAKHLNVAVLILGLAALVRVYPIILVLPFAFTLKGDWVGRLRLAAIGGLPLFASMFVSSSQEQLGAVGNFSTMPHLEYPLAMKFSLGNQDSLYVFVFIYVLIIMYLYLHPQLGFENLKRFCLYVMLTFFATSFFHPHYLIWLIPFAAFYIDIPQFLPLHGVQIGSWIAYTFQWGRPLAGYILAPISPAFFWSINSPSEWIKGVYPPGQIVGFGRSVFSASCLALAYVVWRWYSGSRETVIAGRARQGAIEPTAEEEM